MQPEPTMTILSAIEQIDAALWLGYDFEEKVKFVAELLERLREERNKILE